MDTTTRSARFAAVATTALLFASMVLTSCGDDEPVPVPDSDSISDSVSDPTVPPATEAPSSSTTAPTTTGIPTTVAPATTVPPPTTVPSPGTAPSAAGAPATTTVPPPSTTSAMPPDLGDANAAIDSVDALLAELGREVTGLAGDLDADTDAQNRAG